METLPGNGVAEVGRKGVTPCAEGEEWQGLNSLTWSVGSEVTLHSICISTFTNKCDFQIFYVSMCCTSFLIGSLEF